MFRPIARLFALAAALVSAATAALSAGPDEIILGAPKYPVGNSANWLTDDKFRVGSFSNVDQIFSANTIPASSTPLPLQNVRLPRPIVYNHGGPTRTIDQFLDEYRVTGLLIIKDGVVQVERYQYNRNASHRFISFSMVKSIVSLAIGIAVQDGLIRSLDDLAQDYVPMLRGNGYGETSIRNLLRMSSGMQFSETYLGNDDIALFGTIRAQRPLVEAIQRFNTRQVKQGVAFSYATIETAVLITVLQAVTGGRSIGNYVSTRLWQPMGAETGAKWTWTFGGIEGGSFHATLRDYGRLGVLLANNGFANGRQVVPLRYLIEATTGALQPPYMQAGSGSPSLGRMGYGYQFWIYPGRKRRFSLVGLYGQNMFVDPNLKLVIVITSVDRFPPVKVNFGNERDSLYRGVVEHFGGTW
jgi:CubicO group peptidase (beta-lactamase class C family)